MLSLRRSTPLLLLLLAAAALFEPWLPAGMRGAFGPGTVARIVAAVLCLYVLILVVERERMASDFKQVLRTFQEFHAQKGQAPGGGAATEQQKREAIEILITALESKEPNVKKNAHEHLRRLTGQEIGPEPDAWRAWLARR